MRFRKLRIAWSVFCGIACVLLIVLWVRSYSGTYEGWHTLTRFPNGPTYFYDSFEGRLRITTPQYWEARAFSISHWMCVTVFVGLVCLPWLRWSNRFSLRTLLIATTLVAVVLGLAVWLSARPPASTPLDVGDFPKRVN
jgi:hypothetical protein